MPEFKVEMAADTPCKECGVAVPLAVLECSNCGTQQRYRVNFEEFFAALERGEILDARQGGLVIGRDGLEDDIPMFRHIGGAVFEAVGLMQGGEYILSKQATDLHFDWLQEINKEIGPPPHKIKLHYSSVTSVINTNLLSSFGSLWISAQYIVNRFATAKWLPELEKRNAAANADTFAGRSAREAQRR